MNVKLTLVLCVWLWAVVWFVVGSRVGEPQEAVGWCETEDRGDVVPEFQYSRTFVEVRWSEADDEFYGKASWMIDEELELTTCVVEIPLPEKVWGSKEMDTVGHEFLHCVIGDFHQ
jgi:hypothetical protein